MTASALFRFASGLVLACALLPASAEEAPRLHGFINQRLTGSTGGNNFFGNTSDRLSADYSELGLGVSWRPHTQWQLSGQGIFRRGGESEEQNIEADYLYAAFTPVEDEDKRWSLKLGKAKVPYGLYNDTRDTPMTRPGILAPQSIYLDFLRQMNTGAPGIHLEARQTLAQGDLNLSLSQIKPQLEGENTAWSFLGNRTPGSGFTGELDTRNNESFAGQIGYAHDGGKLRLLLSHARGRAHYRPGTGDAWTGGTFDFRFSALSLQWNGEAVSLSAERARNVFHRRFQSAFLPAQDEQDVGSSWYLQAQWRFAPRWEALLRYDVNRADDDDPDGTAFAAGNPLGLPAWMRFAEDWTLGVRYRLDQRWMLAGEWHRVHGTVWLPPADNLTNGQWDPNQTSPRWNLFLLQATYQF